MADRREKLIKIAGSRFLWRVKWVVSRGVTEEEKNLMLKFAVMKGRLGTVEYLHKKGADIINTTFKYEGNLFQTAVSRSH